MKKQTAVEWLKDQIECFGNKHELQMSWATLDELFDQAKQMEKEQIEDAHIEGQPFASCQSEKSEQYYNKTYQTKIIK
jgi:hypothetical protein